MRDLQRFRHKQVFTNAVLYTVSKRLVISCLTVRISASTAQHTAKIMLNNDRVNLNT